MLLGVRTLIVVFPVTLAVLAVLTLGVSIPAERRESGAGDARVTRIRAGSASLVAADVAQVQTRRARRGLPFARDTGALLRAWLAQWKKPRVRDRMRDWAEYHGLRASAGRERFVVRTSAGPGTSGWFRLAVDDRTDRVTATCGGTPAPGCRRGRWNPTDHGHAPRYYLR
jgi:hypothetical protein